MNMLDGFICPRCGGNMIDVQGIYICKECDYIDGD